MVVEVEGGFEDAVGMVDLGSKFDAVVMGRLQREHVGFLEGLDRGGTLSHAVGHGVAGHTFFVARLNIHKIIVEVELGLEVEELEHGCAVFIYIKFDEMFYL